VLLYLPVSPEIEEVDEGWTEGQVSNSKYIFKSPLISLWFLRNVKQFVANVN